VSCGTLRRRIARAESLAPPPPSAGALARRADEARELAREAAAAFGRLVHDYREHYKLSAQDALARAEAADPALIDHVRTCPPDQVAWPDLEALAQLDQDAALARWAEVKEAARGEIRSAHRAARSLERASSSCWGRARLLAISAEISEAWRPRDALEQMLIDQMAVYQHLVWEWQWVFSMYADLADLRERPAPRKQKDREPYRVTALQAMEKAGELVERFQGLFLTTLRALQGLRRAGPVVVRRAGQVNGGQQQVNVTKQLAPNGDVPRRLP
jgi:hypothetical protein